MAEQPVGIALDPMRGVRSAGLRLGRALQLLWRVNPVGAVSLGVLLLIVATAVFASQLAPKEFQRVDVVNAGLAPNADFWLGTDTLGRDVLSRLMHGARISLLVAFAAVAVGTTGGALWGLASGFTGGKTDTISQRLIEIWMAFPGLILAMLLLVLMGSGLAPVIIAISAARIPGVARVLRSVALVSREYTYVEAARVIGASEARILLRHVLPNAVAPFLILASAGLGSAILTEASLGFLGLGIPPTSAPTWGNMLSGRVTATINPRWWLVVFPGIALTVTVLAFNLFGDALRDLFDPKLRGSEGARGAR